MKKYKVSELQDGMQFSAPVYIDEESLLVPEGWQSARKILND